MIVRYATLAYGGSEAVYRQASMLLLSLLAHAPDPREIVIVTDHPHRFQWFADAAAVRPLGPGELAGWTGPAPFSMRQKLEAARAVMPASGALVLLDADTIARGDLSALVEAVKRGTLGMHRREFELAASSRRGNRALWQQLRGRAFAGWEFGAGDAMWNSGVLALPAADARLLDDALALYDAVASAGIRHFATEQLVAGLVLGRTGRLRETHQWFTHYWGNKKQWDQEIALRLEAAHRGGMTPVEAADALRGDPITLPAELRPGKIEKVKKWLSRQP